LRRTGELLGFPAVSWWGKRYLGGSLALFDVFAVWVRTVPTPPNATRGSAHLVAGAVGAAWIAVALWAFRAARRAREDLRRAHAGSRFQAVVFGATVAACLVHLVWPPFHLLFLALLLRFIGGMAASGEKRTSLPEAAPQGAGE
jgi:hypothetical protein